MLQPTAIAAAQRAQTKWRVWASVSLAQYIVESGGGRFEPPNSNNPFGIQALPGLPSVEAGSHEWRNGVLVPTTEHFAVFASLDDAFNHHAELLATSAYYVRAMKAPSAEGFALALEGVYSTTKGYGADLVAIMREDALEQYDVVLPTPGPVSSPIVALQTALNAHGAKIDVDGMFGPLTKQAVRNFQASAGIEVDGDPGPDTLKALGLIP